MPLERRTGLMESSNVSTPSLVPPNPVPGYEPDCVFFPVIIFGHQYTAESIDLVTQTARVRSANYQERYMLAEAMRSQMLPSGPGEFSGTVERAVGMHLRGGGNTLQVLRIAHYSGTEFAPQTPQDFYQPPVHQPSTPVQPPQLSYPQPPTGAPVIPDPFYDSLLQAHGQPSTSVAGAGAPPPPPPRTTSQLPRSGRTRGRMAEQLEDAIYDAFRTGVFVLPEGATALDIQSAIARVQSGEIAAHWVSPLTIRSVIEQMEESLGATAMPMEPAVDQIEVQLMNALHYHLQGDPFVPPAGATPRMIQRFVEGLMDGSIPLDPSIRRRDMRNACKCMIDTAMAMARGEQVVFPPPLPMQPSSPLPSPQLPQQPDPWAPAPAPLLPLVDEGMAFPYHPEPGEPPAGHDLPTVPMVPTVPIPVPALPVTPGGNINQQLAAAIVTYATGGPLLLPSDVTPREVLNFLESMQTDPDLQQQLIDQGLSRQQIRGIFAATETVARQLLESLGAGDTSVQRPSRPSSRLSSSSSSSSSSESEGEYDLTVPSRPELSLADRLSPFFPQREAIAKALYAGAGTFFDCPDGITSADLRRFQAELIDCQPSTPMERLLNTELPDWIDSKTQYVELLDVAISQLERETVGQGSQHGEDLDDLLSVTSDQELNLEEVEPEPEPHVEIAPQPSPRPSPVQPTQSPQPSQPQAPIPPRVAIAQALASGRGQRFEIPDGVSAEQLRQFIDQLKQAGDDDALQLFMNQWLPYWASYQITYIELLEKAINDLNQSRPEQVGPAQGADSPTPPSQQDLARRAIAEALTAGGGHGFLIPEDVTPEDIQRFFSELRTSKADSAVAAVLPQWIDFKYSYLNLLSLALQEFAQASGSAEHPSQDQDHNQPSEEGAVGGTDVSGPAITQPSSKPAKKPNTKDAAKRLKKAVNDAIRRADGPSAPVTFEIPEGVTLEQVIYRRQRLIQNPPDYAWKMVVHKVLRILQDHIDQHGQQPLPAPKPKPSKLFPFWGKKPSREHHDSPLERAIDRALYHNELFVVPEGTSIEQAQKQHRQLTRKPPSFAFPDDLDAVLTILSTYIREQSGFQLPPTEHNQPVGTETGAGTSTGTGDDLGSIGRAPSPPASPAPSRASSRSPSRGASPVPSQQDVVEQQLETAPTAPQSAPSPSHSPTPSRRSSIASVTSALSVASHTSVGGGAGDTNAPAPSTEGAVGGVDEKGKGKAKKGDGVGFINRLLGRGHGAGVDALLSAIRDAFEQHVDLTVPDGTTARDIREALRRMEKSGYRLPRGTTLYEFRKMILDLQDQLPEFNTPAAQLKQAVLRHIHHGERLYIPEGVSKKDVQYRIRRLKASGGTQIPGVSKERLKDAGRTLNRLLREHLKEQAREDMPPSFIPPSPSRGSSSRSVASQGSAGSGEIHRRPLRSPPPPPVDRPPYVPADIEGSVRRRGSTPPPGDIHAAISTLDLAVGGEEDDRSDASSHRSHTGSQRSSDRSSIKGTDL